MAMILSMQHYGRGVGRVPMPRALARDPRKEWPVSPSFVIFFLAVLIIVSLKLTMSNKKLFKLTQTIIIMPQTQPAPEPTVPKNIPLLKVLKDAVKKTIEPKRVALKKITPQKIEPKKRLETKIIPKKIEPLKSIEKKIDAPKLIPKTIHEKSVAPKKISLPVDPLSKTTPKIITAAPHTFTAMPTITRNNSVIAAPSNSIARPPSNHVPVSHGPLPQLTQWESYKPPVSSEGSPHELKMASPPAQAPIRHINPTFTGPPPEDLVIINNSSIGNSERVKNLKRAIMNKAQKMNPENSPYTYMVKNYTCTLVVEGGVHGKIIIDFSPVDAPFDVVSTLERLLPR